MPFFLGQLSDRCASLWLYRRNRWNSGRTTWRPWVSRRKRSCGVWKGTYPTCKSLMFQIRVKISVPNIKNWLWTRQCEWFEFLSFLKNSWFVAASFWRFRGKSRMELAAAVRYWRNGRYHDQRPQTEIPLKIFFV